MGKRLANELLDAVRKEDQPHLIVVMDRTKRQQRRHFSLERGFQAGADEYLLKPFHPAELHEKIDRYYDS